jgi:hypothetical protein
MQFVVHTGARGEVAEVISLDQPIRSAQDALDVMANAPARAIVVPKELLDPVFFDLSTGLAGEILQKFSNYSVKLGVVGDFSRLASTSLRDFIYECNTGNSVVFVGSIEKAVEKLSPSE